MMVEEHGEGLLKPVENHQQRITGGDSQIDPTIRSTDKNL
jgi:hypothetical protein